MNLSRANSPQGSALISAAVAAAVLAFVAAGILIAISTEYNLNSRAAVWNQALHLSEAGVDIGFSELNYPYYLKGLSSSFLSSDGWSQNGTTFTKTITNLTHVNGSTIGSVVINVLGVGGMTPSINAVATCANTHGTVNISRCVSATLTPVSMFPTALMSKKQMDFHGNNVYVDSYDSTDPSKSTTNVYDYAKRQANGNVASDGTFTNSVYSGGINVGNADIYGVAYTGPGGSVAIGSNGSIGPSLTTRDTSVAAAVAAGHIQSDFNMDVPNVTVPPSVASLASKNKMLNSATLTASDSGKYTGIQLNNKNDVITISGNVVLYITGDVRITGSSAGIVIAPGSSLTVYAGGSVDIAGNGIVNNAGTPIKNQWYGLATSTSWSYTGNAQWTGTIYAPSADVSFKGGGVNGDTSGSVVGDTITMTGNTKFHYDESLRMSNTGAGFQVVSWQELRNVSGVWVP